MPLFDVVVILLCVGVVLYLVSRVPFVAAPMKTIIYWVVCIAVALWLLSLTGILDRFSALRFPHL